MEALLAQLRQSTLRLGSRGQELWSQVSLAKRASVLALIFEYRNQPSVLLTVRASHLHSYAGDVALPGGKAEKGETPLDVALREGHEEVGLSPEAVKVVAQLPTYISSLSVAVVPIVGVLKDIELVNGIPKSIRNNQQEVAACFSLPLEYLLTPSIGQFSTKQVDWKGLRYQTHSYRLLAKSKKIGEPGTYRLWGLTANILVDIARLALGREPLFQHRRSDVYGDLLLTEGMLEKGLFGRDPKKINFSTEFGRYSPVITERIP